MTQPAGPSPQAAPYYPQQPQRPTNTLAIIALVGALVFPPAGIVCGIIARRQIKQTGEQGDGLALAGIIIGWIFVAVFLLAFLVFLVFFGMMAAIFASIPWDRLPSPSDFPSGPPTPFPTS